MCERRGDLEKGAAHRRQAFDLLRGLAGQYPADASYRAWEVECGAKLARNLVRQGKLADAREICSPYTNSCPDDASAQNELAWLLVTMPEPRSDDAATAVRLALGAVELKPDGKAIWNTLGVAHFRAGNWKDSVAALEKAAQLRHGGDSFDWFFLSMAHWQLGHKDESRKLLDQAVQWMEKNNPQHHELRIFRAEAEALILKSPQQPATRSSATTKPTK
jgi:tetratricopeptide (TPR) repeat protein